MTKAIVYSVYIIEMLQTTFGLHDFYTLFCTQQGNRYLENPTDFDIHGFGFMWFTIPLGSALGMSPNSRLLQHEPNNDFCHE